MLPNKIVEDTINNNCYQINYLIYIYILSIHILIDIAI